jgi:hypothetical protein
MLAAEQIQESMTPEGFKTVFLGGAQDRAQRTAIIQQFKTGEAKVLITTNVQAIGVDMQAVSIVINYDIPTLGGNMKMGDAAAYLQRIGGRPPGGRGAVSISLVHNEAGMVALTSITGQHGVSLQQMDSNDWAETANTIEKILDASQASTGPIPSAAITTAGTLPTAVNIDCTGPPTPPLANELQAVKMEHDEPAIPTGDRFSPPGAIAPIHLPIRSSVTSGPSRPTLFAPSATTLLWLCRYSRPRLGHVMFNRLDTAMQ